MRRGIALTGVVAVLSVLWTAPDTHLHNGRGDYDKVLHSHAVQAHEHSTPGSSVAGAEHEADYLDLFSGVTSTGPAAVLLAEATLDSVQLCAHGRAAGMVAPFAHAPPIAGIPLLRAPPA